MKFEEKLYLLREEKGISQNELAETLDVSRQSISKWEMGHAKPDTNHLILISQYFNVSLDYLVKDDINDKNERIHIHDENTHGIDEHKTERKNKRRIWVMLLVFAAIAFLVYGKTFRSSTGASIGFILVGMVVVVLVIYMQIKNFVHWAKYKNERSGNEENSRGKK